MQLTLIRHAKSSWDDPDLSDFDRPLDRRGLRDAPIMARLVADRQQQIDVILSSTALRATQTAQYFADALDTPIEFFDQLYNADPRRVADLITARQEECIAVVAHDPTLSILARHFGPQIPHMPTCAVAWFTWSADSWRDALRTPPTRVQYDIPRETIG